MINNKKAPIFKAALIFVLLSFYLFYANEIDLILSRFFFKLGKNSKSFTNSIWMHYFFTLGPWPAILLAIFSFLAYSLSFSIKGIKKYRAELLYLWLTFAIGSGFLAHGIFKEFWGRPRPKHLIEFGGSENFRPFYNPGPTLKGEEHFRSFPCGHCTTGYYYLVFVYLFRQRKKRLASFAACSLGLFWGTALGVLRIAQGGHFFSDVAAGAFLMWGTAYALQEIINLDALPVGYSLIHRLPGPFQNPLKLSLFFRKLGVLQKESVKQSNKAK